MGRNYEYSLNERNLNIFMIIVKKQKIFKRILTKGRINLIKNCDGGLLKINKFASNF